MTKANMIRYAAILLAALILLCSFCGCGAQDPKSSAEPATDAPETQTPEVQPDASGSGTEPEDETMLPIVDEPVSFSLWCTMPPFVSSVVQDPATDIAIYRLIQEHTNISFEFTVVPNEDEANAFNIQVATGVFTDIVANGLTNYSKTADDAIEEGLYQDITDIIKEYAPTYYSILTGNPDAYMKIASPEGRMCSLSAMYKEGGTSPGGYMIREDWLNDVDMEIPVTYEDFYNVLTAFKSEFEDFKGMCMMPTGGDPFLSAGMNTSAYFYLFRGAYPFYVDNGTVKFGCMEDEFTEYVEMMSKWYSEGLIDRDFYQKMAMMLSMDYSQADELGICYGSVADISAAKEMSLDEDFKLTAISFPVKNAGDSLHLSDIERGLVYGNGDTWCVTTACEQPETIVKLVEWLYTEGNEIANYGTLGESYVYGENGEPEFTELITGQDDSGLDLRSKLYIYAGCMVPQLPYSIDMEKTFYDYGDEEWAAYNTWRSMSDGSMDYPAAAVFSSEQTEEVNAIKGEMATYLAECLTRFVIGEMTVEDIPAFQQQLRTLNVDRFIEIYQEAYDSYLAGIAAIA